MFSKGDIITPKSNRSGHENIYYEVRKYNPYTGEIKVIISYGSGIGFRTLTRPEHYQIIKKGDTS